jgi:hypothetical protein
MKDQSVKEIIYESLFLSIAAPSERDKSIRELAIESNGNKYIERIN